MLKRFKSNPAMKKIYEDFINGYNQLRHLEEISEKDNSNFSYYLPYHGIFRNLNITLALLWNTKIDCFSLKSFVNKTTIYT